MKRILAALTVAVATIVSSAAHADQYDFRHDYRFEDGTRVVNSCSHYDNAWTCTRTVNPTGNSAKIIHVPVAETAEDLAAQEAFNAKWDSFCKPEPVVGVDGLTRMRYAHKNCDIGRAE